MHPNLKRLRELPQEQSPPYGYGEFARRSARRRARQTRAPLRLMAVALAVLVAGWIMKRGMAPLTGDVASLGPAPQQLEQGRPPAAVDSTATVARNAERWLDAQPRSAIVRVPTQMAVTELEDQIAAMDDQLNAVRLAQPHAQQLALLQRDREQLVESLAQVRYAQILVSR
ncbi:MAG TPA: hypothetical protein VMF03_22120 [Steroidobacteraceae bacterium]|nr:hypothetical protein [Steroidobacteraceae bacterium]